MGIDDSLNAAKSFFLGGIFSISATERIATTFHRGQQTFTRIQAVPILVLPDGLSSYFRSRRILLWQVLLVKLEAYRVIPRVGQFREPISHATTNRTMA